MLQNINFGSCRIMDVQMLIKNNHDINLQDKYGRTILFSVTKNGNLNILKDLINRGGDITIKDNDGQSCLIVACCIGNIEIVKFFIEEMKMDKNETTYKNQSCLSLAAKCGRIDVVKYLIENNTDVDILDDIGYNCLMWSISRGNIHVTKYLLLQTNKKINIDEYNNSRETALMMACHMSKFDEVKLLVNNGANVNKINSNKKNALYFAISKGNKNYDIIDYLLQHHSVIDIDCINEIIYECRRKRSEKIKKLLEKYGFFFDIHENPFY